MDKDIRWQQRLENFGKALHRLREALDGTAREPKNHLYQIALIGAFQFTFELSWKTMKDYLVYNGVEVSLPREVVKQAFHHQLIQDGEVWIDMLEDRNLMAHVYQEQAALVVFPKNSCHLDRAKAPGLRLSERGVVSRQYNPPLRQLNRGSFRVGPSVRNFWERPLVAGKSIRERYAPAIEKIHSDLLKKQKT